MSFSIEGKSIMDTSIYSVIISNAMEKTKLSKAVRGPDKGIGSCGVVLCGSK